MELTRDEIERGKRLWKEYDDADRKKWSVEWLLIKQWLFDHAPALLAAAETVAERERLFEAMWAADQRGIKMWQEKHPGKDNVWPDQGNLVAWMLERITELESIVAKLPKTRDGVAIVPGMKVYWPSHIKTRIAEAEAWRIGKDGRILSNIYGELPQVCYSSDSAARSAAGEVGK